MILIDKPFQLYFSAGLSGNGVLTYKERRIDRRIITDGSSPPSVDENLIDQEFHLFLGPHTGLQARFGKYSVGMELSLFNMPWVNLLRMRTTRYEFLVGYTI